MHAAERGKHSVFATMTTRCIRHWYPDSYGKCLNQSLRDPPERATDQAQCQPLVVSIVCVRAQCERSAARIGPPSARASRLLELYGKPIGTVLCKLGVAPSTAAIGIVRHVPAHGIGLKIGYRVVLASFHRVRVGRKAERASSSGERGLKQQL